ncbi:MAG: hypothetical protein K9K37_02355 [Desulfocapsa sp.]|nr:hypothetical protein [Desulfocapsa sp.]
MKRLLRTHIPALLITLLLNVTVPASRAYAVQAHGGAEGLISHELGHLLFFTGMTFLLWRIQKARFTSPGWREFKIFLWLILCWNVLTFTGHWMMETVEAEHFIHHGGHVRSFRVETLSDLIFYLTRLDHLLLVPAFFLLLLSIRKWGRNE